METIRPPSQNLCTRNPQTPTIDAYGVQKVRQGGCRDGCGA